MTTPVVQINFERSGEYEENIRAIVFEREAVKIGSDTHWPLHVTAIFEADRNAKGDLSEALADLIIEGGAMIESVTVFGEEKAWDRPDHISLREALEATIYGA